MKYAGDRPTPEKAARRTMEHARAFEPIQDGRIYIEKINYPMLYQDKATPAEYWAGLEYAKDQGWLEYHESGTFVRMLRERDVRENAAGWKRSVRLGPSHSQCRWPLEDKVNHQHRDRDAQKSDDEGPIAAFVRHIAALRNRPQRPGEH
ncbi:hypothetical protein SAMN05216337_105143 [Bradyrhizobium brasilense]|uniref:Uncharacterized protein n=1 Tax=Bradyrhizobium brasilense TaxID=1419277 RepID=A0A1G7K5P2_9BRAD|nr:hypothetical protein [Bradyrhizobium brasilense]SDF32427.1 hypothetical protein SAMN05216337_105143 [Bradyrhizobium brasilense]